MGVFLCGRNQPAIRWGLLLASMVFYGAWYPPFLPLLLASALVDFAAGRQISRARSQRQKRAWLTLSLITNLGLLGFFKYAGFLAGTLSDAFGTDIGSSFEPILPIGISFYTFQSMSYTIDVYRGRLDATNSLRDFVLFVSFFPQLVAGPIVRASEFLPQLGGEIRLRAAHLGPAAWLFIVGLFKKLVIAGHLGPIVDRHFDPGRVSSLSIEEAWIGVFAFAGQIYGDFSGYTDMARGCARVFGFELPVNFRLPYLARGFSEFWNRWHISLSHWLRDYLYIPLGGNRHGRLRTIRNLLLTMLLGGLWHGAAWTFVAWGLLHGIYLIGERIVRAGLDTAPRLRAIVHENVLAQALAWAVTFGLTMIAWVPFRATDLPHALAYVGQLFAAPSGGLAGRGLTYFVLPVLGHLGPVLACRILGERIMEDARLRFVTALVLLWCILSLGGRGGDFIYFQF